MYNGMLMAGCVAYWDESGYADGDIQPELDFAGSRLTVLTYEMYCTFTDILQIKNPEKRRKTRTNSP